MTVVQHSAANNWFEEAASDVTLPVIAYLQFDGTDWILATTGSQHGQLIPDENGDYVIVDLRTEVLLVADGSDYGISTSGTRIGLLAADSDDVTISTDLTDTVVAELYQDLAGNTVMVRSNNPELKLLSVGSDYIGYEVS